MSFTDWNRNQANDGRDYFKRTLEVGQSVVKATTSGRSAILEFRTVTRINEKGQVYLDDSKVPVIYSGRLCIFDHPEAV